MMTEIEGPEGTSKNPSNHDVPSSRPSLDPTSTTERHGHVNISRLGKPPLERRTSTLDGSGSFIWRSSSIGSAQIQPLPLQVTTCHEDVEADTVTFNPRDLLQEGLGEWHGYANDLQNLKRTSSVSASKRHLGLEQVGRQRSVRYSVDSIRWNEDSPRGAIHRYSMSGGRGGGGRFHILEASQDGALGGIRRWSSPARGFETPERNLLKANSQTRHGEEGCMSQDFYRILAEAPQASVIHLVGLYHRVLVKHGLHEEAENITSMLAGLQNQEDHFEGEELKGMDLLLKEGLLKYLLSIQPHIPQVPRQVVKFKALTYSMDIKVEKGYETMFTKIKGLLEGLLKRPPSENMTLLRDVTGYLMPGTLTLVVGPPGSGKSSFLNVVGGRPTSPGSSFSGTVTYNGNDVHAVEYHRLATVISSFDVHLPSLTVRETLEFARDCTQAFGEQHYSDELKEIMGEALKHGQDPMMEMNLSMLGLKRVADQHVGNPSMSSLKEFQHHRLTTAEMLAGTYAVYIFDELNAGGAVESLTFDMVTSIRMFARIRQSVVLASILHPSEETFNLFDRVILLDGGQVMFQGPRQDVLPYFESLGYIKPKHFSTSEFLSDVTTLEGVRYLQHGYPKLEREDFIASFLLSPTYRNIRQVVDNVDSTVEQVWVQGRKPLGLEFKETRINSVNGSIDSTCATSSLGPLVVERVGSLAEVSMDHTSSISLGDELVAIGGSGGQLNYFKTGDRQICSPLKKNLTKAIDEASEPVRLQLERHFEPVELSGASRTQFLKEYVLQFKPETMILLKRELKVLLRNKLGLQLRFAQVLIMSVYVGITFFQVKDDPDQLVMNLKRAAFFTSALNMTLVNLGQLPGLMEERAVYYKQHGAQFFRPQSFLCAKVLATLPFSLLEATLWTLVTYFMCGFSIEDRGWHFWVFYVIVCLTAINGASLIRFMAFFAPDRNAANAFNVVLIAIFMVFAGFLVPRFVVPRYWLWAYYMDPLQWATTALLINEMNSKSYRKLCSQVTNLENLPQCIGRPTNTIGHAYLAEGQYYTSDHWIAVAIAVLVGWIVFWNIGVYYALARKRHLPQTLSPYTERKITLGHQQQRNTIDEEWGHGIVKLSLESIPITLSWHELHYDAMIPAIGQTRTVLNYVSGWGNPGEIVAILGGHGSGKTSLLNCLAGRKISLAHMGGQVLVNGYPKVQKTFAHVEGYVEDIMAYFPYMTVQEGIEFSAAMRLSKKVKPKQRKVFAEEVMNLVQIGHMANMLFTSGNGEILKEQALRFAIAMELAGNPSVLFLDEPMKGLDSHASRHIMDCLKSIANTGKLVIVCLQQPSPRELTTFNNIQLLKSGGETIYFGPAGIGAESLIKYFEYIPGTPRCPRNKNPVAYALDVIGDGVEQKAHRDYAFEYRVSELALQNHIQLQKLRRSKGESGPELVEFGYRAPYFVMAWEVMVKMQRIYWRNTSYNFGRILGSLILALILGTVYFNINPHTTVKMNMKSLSLFILCALLAISNAQSVVPLLLRMKTTMERDQVTQQYSVWWHSLAWTFGEVPYLAVSTMIVCFIFCLMAQIGVQSASHFFKFFFVLLEFNLAIVFLGIFVVLLSKKPQIAAVIIPIVIGFWTTSSGAVIPKKKLLKTVIWVYWTNPLQYTLNSLSTIAFYCDTNKPTCLDLGRNMACLNDPTACPQCDCKRLDDAGNAFLWTTLKFRRSFDENRVPLDMLILALFCFSFRFAAGCVLTYHKQKRMNNK